MPPQVDETHDPQRRSWVQDANGHADFPIQNLPFGVFRPAGGTAQAGMAIGDQILSLRALFRSGLIRGEALEACEAALGEALNPLLGLGSGPRTALRKAVSALLAEGAEEHPELLHAAVDCALLLPARIGDYTDFYAGIVHAENVGKLFRPDTPLLPNYKWVPIGYHGRSSSICVSGAPVRRPQGQRKLPKAAGPVFGPTQKLDFELELGIWIGLGNRLGEPIWVERAQDHIAGYCLLNDWSARDLQSWEYQPLGPFLGKSFQTSLSGWVVTPEALAPFRQSQRPRPAGDPAPLPYLFSEEDQASGALNVALEVYVRSARMRERGLAPDRVTSSSTGDLYWTAAQMVAHHTSNGCNLRPGDLLGTGTVSSADGPGSLLELTRGGAEGILLSSGEVRKFLLDGDEVIFRAQARREGYLSIGFGECRGIVLPADAGSVSE